MYLRKKVQLLFLFNSLILKKNTGHLISIIIFFLLKLYQKLKKILFTDKKVHSDELSHFHYHLYKTEVLQVFSCRSRGLHHLIIEIPTVPKSDTLKHIKIKSLQFNAFGQYPMQCKIQCNEQLE